MHDQATGPKDLTNRRIRLLYVIQICCRLKGDTRLPNIKSAIKRVRQSEKRRLRNRFIRSRARTFTKKVNSLLAQGRVNEASDAAVLAISALDKAAAKGIIHKNNAARHKSRLMTKLNRARANAEQGT